MTNKHIGSDFDDFLREEGVLAEVEVAALKRVIAFQIEQEMNRRKKEVSSSAAHADSGS
jgi:antitoxin HicB